MFNNLIEYYAKGNKKSILRIKIRKKPKNN